MADCSSSKRVYSTGLLTSFLSLFVFIVVDYFSIGCSLFRVDANSPIGSTAYYSSCVFLLTNILAQLVYALTSGIRTGLVASILYEASMTSKQIAQKVHTVLSDDGLLTKGNFYLNLHLCMAVGVVCFAMLSLVPFMFKWGNKLKNVPLVAVFSVMTYVGFSMITESISSYHVLRTKKEFFMALAVLLVGLGIAIIGIALPKFIFLVPVVTAIIVTGFNLIFRVSEGVSVEDLRKAGLIMDFGNGTIRPIWEFDSLFTGGTWAPKCLLACVGSIATMVLMNVIYININLPPYAFATGQDVNFNREWLSQAISNLVTSFSGFPSYFVSSTSILFYQAGATTRVSSMLAVLAPVLLALLIPYVANFVPLILAHIILSYLGFSFLYSYFLQGLTMFSVMDNCLIFLGALICCIISPVAGFAIITAIAATVILQYYMHLLDGSSSKAVGQPVQRILASEEKIAQEVAEHAREVASEVGVREQLQDAEVSLSSTAPSSRTLKVNYIMSFATLDKVKADLGLGCSNVILDLSECPYVDMNANLFLLGLAGQCTTLGLIGTPDNLYKGVLSGYPNVTILPDA